tara:strand:+ start:61 stop:1227 length:1167 start_codon:yes stop_codon:yes gene_type:complete
MNNNLWLGMPEFIQEKIEVFKVCRIYIKSDSSYIILRFNDSSDFYTCGFGEHYGGKDFYFDNRDEVETKLKQKITRKTKSIWFPYKSHWGDTPKRYKSQLNIGLRYPIYIVSKGRSKNGLTTKALDKMGVPHFIVVEIHEAAEYKKCTNAKILVLPSRYLSNYETCDDLGNSKSKGPGAARNFCIDHSASNGFNRHWVMDDNLDAFHYLNKNEKLEVDCDSTLAAAEDFVDRFSNVPVAGMNYYSFCKKTDSVPPIVLNTRIYSCLLIDNGSGYRWRGRYNEDTDLSLRVLKDGLCTIQFNAFLCGKVTTQRMKGGNSKEFYDSEGTLPKSQMIENLHPDVAKVVWRFNRWHHHVNYKPFKNNALSYENYNYSGIDNYRMVKYFKGDL